MKRKWLKILALSLAASLIYEIGFPVTAWALTSGPSQPEVQSFEPIGTSEMVDLFSGDFNYNIPLLDVEGYPVNISYHSGIGMDQEASWVGLGWNINPGVVNRNMRGLPDDFKGEKIHREMNLRKNTIVGGKIGMDLELLGISPKKKVFDSLYGSFDLNFSLGVFHNNYKGLGLEYSITPSISIAGKSKLGLNASLGISGNSQSGFGVSPSLGLSYLTKKTKDIAKGYGVTASATFNSRTGVQELSFRPTRTGFKTSSKNRSGSSYFNNGNLNFTIGTPTYIPQLSMPLANSNWSVRGTVGTEIFPSHPAVFLDGYISTQFLKANEYSKNAYGYLYSEATQDNDVLLDFNREKDGILNKGMPNLPVTNFTYDLYSVSGQGTGGMFYPHRGDIGVLHDDNTFNSSIGGSLGVEIGVGNVAHSGVDAKVTFSSSTSGLWEEYYIKKDLEKLDFQKPDYSKEPLYEPYYFKGAGEKSAIDEAYYYQYGYDKPVRLGLSDKNTKKLMGSFIPNYKNEGNAGNEGISYLDESKTYRRKVRDKRNQSISALTAEQALRHALDKEIHSYDINTVYNGYNYSSFARNSHGRANHSLSEITVTNPNGTRYVYGISAYNRSQVEANFNAGNDLNNKGQVVYTSGTDDSKNNSHGADHYYTKTTTPGYAYGYLLTAVLSADYVDITGDGISADDLGTYTKVNYSMITENYHWRDPYEAGKANLEEGLKSNPRDNRGNYMYGEKEIWMVNSIESKNYIAEFKLERRDDGYGVSGSAGGINLADSVYRLKEISLYSKKDRLDNRENAVPIKTVHFEYSYDLCKGVLNNRNNYDVNGNLLPEAERTGGKLTLKKIYFTYGNSQKGQLSPYVFDYSESNDDLNPDYHPKAYDRWGNYKPFNEGLTNLDYPFTDQDSRTIKADVYAQAWTLRKIKLPSGGEINVEYESDDYGYVQDKAAMQMFKIAGFANSGNASTLASTLYNPNHTDDLEEEAEENNYIYFDLEETISGSEEVKKSRFYDRYVKYIVEQAERYIYFSCFLEIKDGTGQKEFVRGFAQMDEGSDAYGVTDDGTKGWIKLKLVSMDDKEDKGKTVNPIAKTAWQFARQHMSYLIYPGSDPYLGDQPGLPAVIAMGMDMKTFFKGFNKTMRGNRNCKNVELGKSWIRLQSPDKIKIGGGLRVKKLTISDKWSVHGAANTGASDFQYGQEYTYTIEDPDDSTQVYSSGVASYEPMIGNEENPWRQPVYNTIEKKGAPDDILMNMQPYGESFFPAASVGYSRVKVANLSHEGVERTATGHTVHEFYTAKDFPTGVYQTALKMVRSKPDYVGRFLGITNKDKMTASQGYAIELNDMHGKPRSQKVYREGTTDPKRFISGIEYKYLAEQSYDVSSNNHPLRLSNKVDVIHRDNSVTREDVGVEIDMSIDMRQNESSTTTVGLEFNTDAFLVAVLPGAIPTLWPSYNSEYTCARTAVVTKVIRRYGVLTEITAYEDGAKIKTENLAFDAETGEVLLTKTQNEYEDEIYNLSYPAHWVYEGMGPAYKNIHAKFKSVQITPSSITLPNGMQAEDYLVPGDEVEITGAVRTGFPVSYLNHTKAYVQKNASSIYLINKNGYLLPAFNCDLMILRSGRRNLQTLPIQSVTCLNNPIKGSDPNRYIEVTVNESVINTAAVEYEDEWPNQCAFGEHQYCDSLTYEGLDLVNLLSYFSSEGLFYEGSTGSLDALPLFDTSVALKPYLMDTTGSTIFNYFISIANDVQANESWLSLTFDGEVNPDCNANIVYPALNYDFSAIEYFMDKAVKVISNNTVWIPAKLSDGSVEIFEVTFECGDIYKCYTTCEIEEGKVLNPFVYNLQDAWRKKKDFLYLDQRQYTSPQPLTRKDGSYSSYAPYWAYNSQSGEWAASADEKWTWTKEVTKFNTSGIEVENKDALNRYTAAIYGYSNTLPVGVASNARYNQIAYDGFEDYDFDTLPECRPHHWDFRQSAGGSGVTLDGSVKHSGKKSLKLDAHAYVQVNHSIENCESDTLTYSRDEDFMYKVNPCDCIGIFSPDSGKYVVSGWVKLDTSIYALDYESPYISVDITTTSGHQITSHHASGLIIEGWQRIEDTLTIPANATHIQVKLQSSHNHTTWFDDIRIHPFNSNMKSFAYDERTLRLVAELDENNYATFYEYDKEGALVRVKKETVDGIVTLQENRNSTFKQEP